MFRSLLEETARRLPGCEAAVLVGRDGMVVEHWTSGGAPPGESLAAELTPLIRSTESLANHVGGGVFRDLLLRLGSWTCYLQPLNDEVFLVLLAGRDAIPGRLRFEGSRAATRLERELS